MKEKIRIGIMSYEDYKKRTMEIAAGKRKRKAEEPRVWFPSIESAMQVLSTKNQKLLRTIIDKRSDSISTLGKLTGRNVSNLSRTLKTMERYGLVKMTRKQRRVVPQVSARTLEVELDLSTGSD